MDMSPSVYLALCALVKDAMEVSSDAGPILRKAALELAAAAASPETLPAEIQAKAAIIGDMASEASARKSAA
jgi:hypothetical protein